MTDPEGRQREQIVNVMDRVRFAREHDGTAWRQTEYRYDGHGNTTWVQDAAGALTLSVFDDAGRKTSMSDPSMGNWSYAYNAAGELTSQTDANSVTVSMTCDVLGRIKTRSEPEGTTTWTRDDYNALGQVSRIRYPSVACAVPCSSSPPTPAACGWTSTIVTDTCTWCANASPMAAPARATGRRWRWMRWAR